MPQPTAKRTTKRTAQSDNQPINEADRQARAAFRLHCDETGGHAAFAQRHGMNSRSAERIYAMRRDVPPSLARTVAAEIRDDFATMNRRPQLADRARALELWAQDCADRSAARRNAGDPR